MPYDPVAPGDLSGLLRPRTVAVVGASNRRGTIGGELFLNLLRNEFNGPVYPVNARASTVHSVHAWPTIAALPERVDLAIIAVPAAVVEAVMLDCAEGGVRAVVVISAGFREVGPAGARAERRLLDIARAHGMRMVGPNCLGLVSTAPEVRLDATFAPTFPPAGTVAVASQSGALGAAMLDYAAELGVGVSDFVSLGNNADVAGADLLDWWEQDERTRVILLYLESFGDAQHFAASARRVNRKKPIVAVKSGRSRRGLQATSSHTGSLAGSDRAVEALVRATGIIRVDTVEALFDMAAFLAHQPLPRGRRVAILTNAGGPGILATDACARWGLAVEDLSAETVTGLQSFLPPEASFRNPVDMIASASPEAYEQATRLVLADERIDALIALFVPPIVTNAAEVGQAIVRAAAGTAKPVLSCFMGRHGVPEALRSLQAGHIPSYAFPETAVQVLARAADHAENLARPLDQPPDLGSTPRNLAGVVIEGAVRGAGTAGRWLQPAEIETLLGAYGIPAVRARFAASAASAEQAAQEVGYPVVMKLQARGIEHKTDVGGVRIDLADATAVREAFAAIETNLAEKRPEAKMEGVLIQPCIHAGVEVIVGTYRDPLFGPLIMFGTGGITVELLGDVDFRLAPISPMQAAELIGCVQGAPLLKGYRGAPPADLTALVDCLVRVSIMVDDLPEIQEIDLNPIKVQPAGQGCIAVDARIRVARATTPPELSRR